MSPTPKCHLLLLLFTNFALIAFSTATQVDALGWGGVQQAPSETECRPYIEKALKEQLGDPAQEAAEQTTAETPPAESHQPPSEEVSTEEETASQEGSIEVAEDAPVTAESNEETTGEEQSEESQGAESTETDVEESENKENQSESGEESAQADEPASEDQSAEEQASSKEEEASPQVEDESQEQSTEEVKEDQQASDEDTEKNESETDENKTEEHESTEEAAAEASQETTESTEDTAASTEQSEEDDNTAAEETTQSDEASSKEATEESAGESTESAGETKESAEETTESAGETTEQTESTEADHDSKPDESAETDHEESKTEEVESGEDTKEDEKSEETLKTDETESEEEPQGTQESDETEEPSAAEESKEEVTSKQEESQEDVAETQPESSEEPEKSTEEPKESSEEEEVISSESPEEEDLTLDDIIPDKLRTRDHVAEILRLGTESAETENIMGKTVDITLRELKRLYDNAIKPLEMLYKYRDLSNRHFGDPEIFSKPLVLFMGPWSGGKSSIINYLLDNEYSKTSLRTGAEPSPAYFNIVMWGEDAEILDGTQLAADWTFSGLQKFGQGLLDRLRGLRLNKPILEKVNIVEIPGILEIRKQVERMFPFNDACQWFIDRADIIFLVYDPSKLDVGPETEAILDQLKGREYQTRIILNKADQIKPEELMRVQGTLIWNISPLMSSPEPPVMYSTSLWSIPYEVGSPVRLLYAQERAFLRDLREAVDKRVENKIASARRFAVRVRNHAKMVDCYLTTFYNHKSFFGNRKNVADDIIEHPQNYHIYEGLSTLTNISRYDLPDPEVYRDFFRLNPVYEFQQLAATCTYFRGCPINRLDIAIAYDLPELVGKYKKSAEQVVAAATAGSKAKPKS